MDILIATSLVAVALLCVAILSSLDRIRRAIIAASDLNLEAQKKTRDVLEDEISTKGRERIQAIAEERRERFG